MNPDQSKESKPQPVAAAGGGSGQQVDYAPYPKLEPDDAAPVPNTWSANSSGSVANETPRSPSSQIPGGCATSMPPESNPYVSSAPAPKNNVEKVKSVLGKWGKMATEASKKAEDMAGNMWQHYYGFVDVILTGFSKHENPLSRSCCHLLDLLLNCGQV